eukprot:TRINITY_DN9871_c0_g1_i2.p2 TRINITY_DN9871_c0_g1~~TRINITY_DN9871_c0_g1_i2.p2  ORF type:complete len:253 (+),score=65.97 TRINITY_DN9871_c0_g1_i2:2506-3264(+)
MTICHPFPGRAEPTCDHDKVLLLYLTKAVVMRGYKHQKTMTAAYFKALASDESDILSNGIGLILDDATWWLCRASHGQARLMYKQRFFQENLATLLEGYKQANSSDVQRKYMTAVGHMLQNVPETVLAAHFDQVLPIVLASLSGEDQTAAQASLKLLASMLESSPDLLEPHAGSLIKSGLALTMAPNTLHVRQQALRCLTQLAYSLDATKLMPYTKSVIKKLIAPLDDRKRLVRQAAADCRCAWFAVRYAET